MQTLKATAILFDMDGTLIDSNEASEVTWKKWAAANQVPIERIREVHHGRRPEETIAIVAPHLNALEEARSIYAEQESMSEGIHPIAGANNFFESVPRSHAALVTAATRKIVGLRFAIVGLVPPSVCVTAETLKVGKPDPEGYLKAAKQLGFQPEECVVFEDAPAGLIAADRAGMRSVAILSNYTQEQLQHELGPAIVPMAFLPNLLGVTFAEGTLTLPTNN